MNNKTAMEHTPDWEDCTCKEYCSAPAHHNGKRINCRGGLPRPVDSEWYREQSILAFKDSGISDPSTYITELNAEVERLKAQNDRMIFMIENGLGWNDMKEDDNQIPKL